MGDNDKLAEELKAIREELKLIRGDCKKMSTHIDLVEHVYSAIKAPFAWFINRINQFRGISTEVELISIGEKSIDEK